MLNPLTASADAVRGSVSRLMNRFSMSSTRRSTIAVGEAPSWKFHRLPPQMRGKVKSRVLFRKGKSNLSANSQPSGSGWFVEHGGLNSTKEKKNKAKRSVGSVPLVRGCDQLNEVELSLKGVKGVVNVDSEKSDNSLSSTSPVAGFTSDAVVSPDFPPIGNFWWKPESGDGKSREKFSTLTDWEGLRRWMEGQSQNDNQGQSQNDNQSGNLNLNVFPPGRHPAPS